MELAPRDLPWADDAVEQLGSGGAIVHDGWLGSTALASLRTEVAVMLQSGRLRAAGLGQSHGVNAQVRGDWIAWIAPHEVRGLPGLGQLVAGYDRLMHEASAAAYLGLRRYDLQLAVFDTGSRYVSHRDAFVHGNRRRLTAIYYLQEEWHESRGGALVLHLPGGPVRIYPKADRLVVFLAEKLLHEVEEVLHGPRLALTAFFAA